MSCALHLTQTTCSRESWRACPIWAGMSWSERTYPRMKIELMAADEDGGRRLVAQTDAEGSEEIDQPGQVEFDRRGVHASAGVFRVKARDGLLKRTDHGIATLRWSSVHRGPNPRCYPHPSMTSEKDARSALEREIYWAEEATVRSRMDTSEVRDLLHDFAMLMRADAKQVLPRGEPELGSGSRLRRKTKVLQFRILRPMRKRNDRLLAEFGELTAALARPPGRARGRGEGSARQARGARVRIAVVHPQTPFVRGGAETHTESREFEPSAKPATMPRRSRSPASGTRRPRSCTRWRSGALSTSPNPTAWRSTWSSR